MSMVSRNGNASLMTVECAVVLIVERALYKCILLTSVHHLSGVVNVAKNFSCASF